MIFGVQNMKKLPLGQVLMVYFIVVKPELVGVLDGGGIEEPEQEEQLLLLPHNQTPFDSLD